MTNTKEAEMAVISCLIHDSTQIETTKEALPPEMFYHPDTTEIYQSVCEIGVGVDLITLKEHLSTRNKFKQAGGVQNIIECVETEISAASLGYYIGIVKSRHQKRLIEKHASKVLEIAKNPELKPHQKLAGIEIDFQNRLGGNRKQGQDAIDKLNQLLEDTISGKRTAISLPWDTTNALTNCLLPGSVTLLCGSPGASKSFMLLQALLYWLKIGVPCCCYELEESVEYHQLRALAQLAQLPGLTSPKWILNNPEQTREAHKAHSTEIRALGDVITAEPDQQVTLQQLAFWADKQARNGMRVICIDPVTIAAYTRRDSWNEDGEFIEKIKRVAVDYNCSVVLVSHPTKQNAGPGLESLAGGAAYSRFCQTAIWLHNHETKESEIRTACGRTTQEHNRTLHLLKSRNGSGQGAKLAYMFDVNSLTLQEVGLIIPKGK